jgi:hypothetical protein
MRLYVVFFTDKCYTPDMSRHEESLPPEALMTEREVARMLHVSERAVYDYRRRGLLKSLKLPGRDGRCSRTIRYRRADVLEFLGPSGSSGRGGRG